MPTNVTFHYLQAEREFHEAETTQQKIKCLKKMLATAPTHKGAERLRADLKGRIARFKYKGEIEKKTSKSGRQTSIPKEGAAQIVFLGIPNSGKSTLLSKLSGKKVPVAEYEFTTKKPEVRMIPYENVWLQGVEIPAIYAGFADTKHGRQMFSTVRNSDYVVLVLKNKSDRKLIEKELKLAGLKLGRKKERKGLDQVLPFTEVEWHEFDKDLAKKFWKAQKKIRVQTRSRGRIAKKPIILPAGATVETAAKIIHKDFLEKFRYTKIWGPSAKFQGQQVGLDHKLKDEDVIEVFLK